MRPDLGQIERVEAIGLGVVEWHDLHMQRPARALSALDRFVEIPRVVVAVDAGQPIGLRLGQELVSLIGLEMVFHPELLTLPVTDR